MSPEQNCEAGMGDYLECFLMLIHTEDHDRAVELAALTVCPWRETSEQAAGWAETPQQPGLVESMQSDDPVPETPVTLSPGTGGGLSTIAVTVRLVVAHHGLNSPLSIDYSWAAPAPLKSVLDASVMCCECGVCILMLIIYSWSNSMEFVIDLFPWTS